MPACFECGAPAAHHHHVVPRVLGGTRTVPLCTVCHGKVHDTRCVPPRELIRGGVVHTGGDVPSGFTLAADGTTLLPAGEECALVPAIQVLRARGLSQRAVVAELTREGFTTRKGKAFSLRQVQRIMQQAQIA